MCDVCKSHMWIARCFDLIFTTIKTKKKKAGSDPQGQARPPPLPWGPPTAQRQPGSLWKLLTSAAGEGFSSQP